MSTPTRPRPRPRVRSRTQSTAPTRVQARAPLPLPSVHCYAVVRSQLIDVTQLTPPQVADVRAAEAENAVFCPTCQGPLRVVISATGPVCVHTPENPFRDHEVEDPHSRQAKHLLLQTLQSLFSSGNVQLDVQLPNAEQIADVALTNPQGGKVVVEYQTQDLSVQQVRARISTYENQGVRCLWLLDIRRLKLAKKGDAVKKATLNKLETALLAVGEPIIYVDAPARQIVWLRPNPSAVELALSGDARIGQVECLLRRYHLSSLRVRDGNWWVDTSLDEDPPAIPALPANLQKRLDRRRKKV